MMMLYMVIDEIYLGHTASIMALQGLFTNDNHDIIYQVLSRDNMFVYLFMTLLKQHRYSILYIYILQDQLNSR